MPRNTPTPVYTPTLSPDIYTLTMVVSPTGSGSTTPSVIGTHTYDEGTVVAISATPATGYHFDHWSGDVADPNSASTTVTMDADKTVTANFELDPCYDNKAPTIDSITPTTVNVGEEYLGQVNATDADATDPEGHTLTYAEGTEWPTWLSLDTSTGEISGTVPCCTDPPGGPCYFDVDVEVSDECSTVTQSFTIEVKNDPPKITSSPYYPWGANWVEIGESYEYNVVAEDSDSDDLTFALGDHPDTMTISKTGPKTATINWTGTCGSGWCTYDVEVIVSDECSEDVQSYTIYVYEPWWW